QGPRWREAPPAVGCFDRAFRDLVVEVNGADPAAPCRVVTTGHLVTDPDRALGPESADLIAGGVRRADRCLVDRRGGVAVHHGRTPKEVGSVPISSRSVRYGQSRASVATRLDRPNTSVRMISAVPSRRNRTMRTRVPAGSCTPWNQIGRVVEPIKVSLSDSVGDCGSGASAAVGVVPW